MSTGASESLSPTAAGDYGQQDLIRRAEQVLSQDDRVLGVWLMGSHGRGTSDQFSDVDLFVVVEEEDIAGFCADWPNVSDSIAPTIFRRQLGDRPVFNHITPDWLRLDVLVAPLDALSGRTRSTVSPVYDPKGLSSRLAEPSPPKPPNPERIASVTVEFLRVLGLLPVVIDRP